MEILSVPSRGFEGYRGGKGTQGGLTALLPVPLGLGEVLAQLLRDLHVAQVALYAAVVGLALLLLLLLLLLFLLRLPLFLRHHLLLLCLEMLVKSCKVAVV